MVEPKDWINGKERNPRYMKPVYPWYRLSKNISWNNFFTYSMGIIYGIVTLEFIRKWKLFVKRLKPGNIWLPPVDGRKWI